MPFEDFAKGSSFQLTIVKWTVIAGSLAEGDVKMASFSDEINCYSYLYPVELPSKKVIFKW